jgi:hypothetical protein
MTTDLLPGVRQGFNLEELEDAFWASLSTEPDELETSKTVRPTTRSTKKKTPKPRPKKVSERMTCSKYFWNLVITEWPAFCKASNKSYLRLFMHLIFCAKRDKQGCLVIPSYILAELEGKAKQLSHKNYVGSKYLKQLQEIISPEVIDYSSTWRFTEGRARTVTLQLPSNIKSALQEELLGGIHSYINRKQHERVYCLSGDNWSVYRDSKATQAHQLDIQEAVDQIQFPPAKFIADHLNNLHERRFTDLSSQHWQKALKVAQGLVNFNTAVQQRRLVEHVIQKPKPLYRPSRGGKTVRLYAAGASLQGLQRDVRKAFLSGYHEADLACCHWAIVAKWWGLPLITDLLKQKLKPWAVLMEHMGIPATHTQYEELKKLVKKACQAIIYGQSSKNRIKMLNEGFLDVGFTNAGKHLCSHPLVKELCKAKGQALKQIKADGGISETPHTTRLILETQDVKPEGKSYLVHKCNANSLVAQYCQMIEMQLLLPVFKLAESEKAKPSAAFTIVLYLFDGVVLAYTDNERAGLWQSRIEQAVKAKADALKITTWLDWKDIP